MHTTNVAIIIVRGQRGLQSIETSSHFFRLPLLQETKRPFQKNESARPPLLSSPLFAVSTAASSFARVCTFLSSLIYRLTVSERAILTPGNIIARVHYVWFRARAPPTRTGSVLSLRLSQAELLLGLRRLLLRVP